MNAICLGFFVFFFRLGGGGCVVRTWIKKQVCGAESLQYGSSKKSKACVRVRVCCDGVRTWVHMHVSGCVRGCVKSKTN